MKTKIKTAQISKGVDKETGLGYAIWSKMECEKENPCEECNHWDIYNSLCSVYIKKELLKE